MWYFVVDGFLVQSRGTCSKAPSIIAIVNMSEIRIFANFSELSCQCENETCCDDHQWSVSGSVWTRTRSPFTRNLTPQTLVLIPPTYPHLDTLSAHNASVPTFPRSLPPPTQRPRGKRKRQETRRPTINRQGQLHQRGKKDLEISPTLTLTLWMTDHQPPNTLNLRSLYRPRLAE